MVSLTNISNNEKHFFNFNDLNISRFTYSKVISYLETRIKEKQKTFCVTLNLDIMRIAYKKQEYYNILQSADFIFADGMPILWLSRLDKNPVPERTAGSDIVYDLCKLSNEKGYKIFMLGAAPGVADKAKGKLEKSLPNIQVTGTYSPEPQELLDEDACQNIVEMINTSEADILFVALGAPKQEEWVSRYYNKLKPYVIIPCGGSIDFIAGTQSKSPQWIGKIGLEWLYRLINNPRRLFKRYIIQDLPFFLGLVLKMKLNINILDLQTDYNLIENTK
jgi:exopolysaccharide biosynthesis WecB/TagA/CpsF family protein